MNKNKYIVLFPIEGEPGKLIRAIADKISEQTKLSSPFNKLPPHVTFHRPISEIDEQKVIDFAKSTALQIHQTRIRIIGLDHFGKEYIVMPAIATLTLSMFWTGVQTLLSRVPEYKHGEFDHDNTLHITVGENLSEVFDYVWEDIRLNVRIQPIDIMVKKISVYGKVDGSMMWKEIVSFPLPTK